MRKSLLVLSAAAIALSGMAATQKQQQRHASSLSFDRSVELKGKSGRNLAAPARKAPAKINTPEDVIHSAEGTRVDMNLNATGYYASWWGLDMYENRDFASHIVYGENDEVYIFNIIPLAATDTYVKGVKKDDKIVIDLPQTVAWSEEEDEGANLNILDYFYDEETEDEGYVPVEGASLELSIAEDGSISTTGLSDEHMLGLSYSSDDMWSGFGVWELNFTKSDKQAVTVPEDLEVSKNAWMYKCEALGYGWPLNFAQGEDLYFQGLSEVMPEAWVKASVEYGDSEAVISIPQNQYVGIYGGMYVYTKVAQVVVDEEYGWEFYELVPDDQPFELIWDYEEETIRVKDPNVSLLFNLVLDDIDYLDEMYEFVLMRQESYEGVPTNPTDLDYYDMMEDYDFSVLEFQLPAFSTDGDVLLTSDLSYVVYVDGEEYTFDPEEYWLDEPMTEVPWNFENDWIMKSFGSSKHAVYLFAEGISTLGVQSVYRYNDEETRSEIVTLNLDDPSAVNSIAAGKKIAEVKYYGIDGREVANPASGIFVKRVTFDDGSVATFKKAIR